MIAFKYGATNESIQVQMSDYLSARGLESANIAEVVYLLKDSCDSDVTVVERTLTDGITKDDSNSTLYIKFSDANFDSLSENHSYIQALKIRMDGMDGYLYPDWANGYQNIITITNNCF